MFSSISMFRLYDSSNFCSPLVMVCLLCLEIDTLDVLGANAFSFYSWNGAALMLMEFL